LKLPAWCDSDLTLAADLKAKFEEDDDGSDIYITVVRAMNMEGVKAFRVVKNK
jgi:hypothetical protein